MIKDIESISSCQQELFKVYLSNGEIYYYKKFLSNCSWWTFDNEPLYEREKHVYQIMRDHGIPIPTAEFVDESQIIITKEVEGVQASQVDSETMHHLIGFWLKKIHKNGYIHGDFHHDNIIFNQKKCDVVILDFEETIQSDKLLYDLATFYRSTFFYFPETGRKLWNSFLRGYGLPSHLTLGIEDWCHMLDMRNKIVKEWAKQNQIEEFNLC